MQTLQMVDLKNQYLKIKPQIDSAIQKVIDNTQFIKSSEVKEFEQNLSEYLEVKHVIACGNGTDALQIALMALGLKAGDEVITSDFTFIATVEVIALLGLKPVLVDVDYSTFNIDAEAIKKAITPKTKAIIPVHIFGQCANMNEITKIAKQHKLYVVEDNAQAIGAEYTCDENITKKSGTIGDIGTTSFFPSKNLGCFGDGGALFTNNDEIAENIRMIANHGMKKRYYHDMIGVNSRLDSIQAAVLNVKLKYLNSYCKARQQTAGFYNNAFENIKDIETPKTEVFTTHVFHQYTLKIKNGKRDALKKYLEEKQIPAMIYYPIPLHEQKAFAKFVNKNQKFDITNKLSEEVLSLPMHTELDNKQLVYITKTVVEFFK